MRLVIDFGEFLVTTETITQKVNKLDKRDIEKISKPYYLVNAKEVYTGEYFVLKQIDRHLSLVLDKSFKLLVVDNQYTDNCNLAYSYKIIGDTKKKYLNSVSYKRNKFTSQLGHIEYVHGFRNVSKGMRITEYYEGYNGILVDERTLGGVCHSQFSSYSTLYVQYKNRIAEVHISPIYNYRNWTHNFKPSAVLVGKYFKRVGVNSETENLLVKLVTDSPSVHKFEGNVEIECDDLEPNTTSNRNKYWQSDLKDVREARQVYVYSKKYSNFHTPIATRRSFYDKGIVYEVLDGALVKRIKLEDIIENKITIGNISIKDGYVDVLGIDGHFRYSIKEYYAYYKLTQAEQSLKYKTQKLIKPNVSEVVRENGELISLKMDSHILEIPRTCKEITSGSLTILPSNKVLFVPSSVKKCSWNPLVNTSTADVLLEEIIIEERIPELLVKLLDLNRLSLDKTLKIQIDKLSKLDILSLYDTRPHVEIEITDKNWRLDGFHSGELMRYLRRKVKNDTDIYKYRANTQLIEEKKSRLEKFKSFVEVKYLKRMQRLIDILESVKN